MGNRDEYNCRGRCVCVCVSHKSDEEKSDTAICFKCSMTGFFLQSGKDGQGHVQKGGLGWHWTPLKSEWQPQVLCVLNLPTFLSFIHG